MRQDDRNDLTDDEVLEMIDALVDGILVGPKILWVTRVSEMMRVSTVETSDGMGIETAICWIEATGQLRAVTVERYPTLAAAKRGHERWVKNVPSMRQVVRIGWKRLIAAEVVDLPERVQ